MKALKFGIEVEMTGITRADASDAVARLLGVSVFHKECGRSIVVDDSGRIWRFIHDASIVCQRRVKSGGKSLADWRYSVEMVTPVLGYDDLGLLSSVLGVLSESGAFVNKSCGIHIHVDGSELSPLAVRNLLNLMSQKEDILYRALKVEKCRLRYCHKLEDDFIEALNFEKPETFSELAVLWYSDVAEMKKRHSDTRYSGINLHSLFNRGTIEFRMFNSTLDSGKVEAYIQFCLAVTHKASLQRRADCRRSETSNEKYCMRCWLIRLGLTGDEYKGVRKCLLENLSGDSAWRYGKRKM